MSVAELRDQYRDGPVGLWVTRLGGGFEITHGTNLEFRADGSGTEWHWGGEPEYPDGESEFRWRSTGDRTLEITHEDDNAKTVRFDFLIRFNEYNIREDVIFEIDHWGLRAFNENGFWISAHPLVRSNTSYGPASIWQRIANWWRK
jgi:hypothetical protein